MATATISQIAGKQASLKTTNDSFFKDLGSKPRPALISIIVNAVILKM